MATHTDYKFRYTDTAGVTTVTVYVYEGEYRLPAVADDVPAVSRYHRDALIGERVYTFRSADFTERKLRNYLDDALDGLNALTNIPEQVRKVAPSLAPDTTEVRR